MGGLTVGGRRVPTSLNGVSVGEGALCQVVYGVLTSSHSRGRVHNFVMNLHMMGMFVGKERMGECQVQIEMFNHINEIMCGWSFNELENEFSDHPTSTASRQLPIVDIILYTSCYKQVTFHFLYIIQSYAFGDLIKR